MKITFISAAQTDPDDQRILLFLMFFMIHFDAGKNDLCAWSDFLHVTLGVKMFKITSYHMLRNLPYLNVTPNSTPKYQPPKDSPHDLWYTDVCNT